MNKELFRERLRECIEESGFSKKELAENIGIRPSTLEKYLQGSSVPSLKMLYKMKCILNFSVDYILGMK